MCSLIVKLQKNLQFQFFFSSVSQALSAFHFVCFDFMSSPIFSWFSDLISSSIVLLFKSIAYIFPPFGDYWSYLCCLIDGQYLWMLRGTLKDIFSSFSPQTWYLCIISLLLLMLIRSSILIFIFVQLPGDQDIN
jgi:hypothetical protein